MVSYQPPCKLIECVYRYPPAFDPKPFIKTFSPALDQLLFLRKQVSEKTEVLEEDVRKAEREYSSRLEELDGGFEVRGWVAYRYLQPANIRSFRPSVRPSPLWKARSMA